MTDQTVDTANDTNSLLDNAPALSEGEWWLAEGVKGEGDKPESFMSDKYKTLADQANAYPASQKMLGAFTGAPKDGYTPPDGIEQDDELFKEFTDIAQELNMNQEGAAKILDLYFKNNDAVGEVDQEAELAKLGDNASERIKKVESFMKNSLGDKFDEHMGAVNSAESVALVEALINATGQHKLPSNDGVVNQGVTMEDIEKEAHKKDEHGRLLRSSSPEHNKKVEGMLAAYHNQ